MSEIKKNYVYNVIYQILSLILPLVTIPYVSRILGATGVGTYSYTYSIVSYFMILTLLGIENHGNRSVAKVRDSKKEASKTFLSIYIIQIFMMIVMIVIYILYCFFFTNQYRLIAFLQFFYILSAGFNISWFFFGLEKFKITILRSSVVKIITLVMIFLFVKDENDLSCYTLILSLGTFISQLSLFPFLKKELVKVRITFADIKKQIKPILILFIPVLSVSLYKIMDKIMLGLIADVSDVGYYEQAEKIINVPISIIASLGVVMLPRSANLISNKKIAELKLSIEKSIEFVMFLAFPMMFGTIAVADDFVPIFLGNEFLESINILKLLAITILFTSLANVIRKQYIVPMEYDKLFIISVLGGGVINLILNAILIPKYTSIGASVATLVTEFLVMFIQIIVLRKELYIKKYLSKTIKFFVTGLIMYICVKLLSIFFYDKYIITTCKIIFGTIIYALLNMNYIKRILCFNLILRRKNEKNI